MKYMKWMLVGLFATALISCEETKVNIVVPENASNRVLFASEELQESLTEYGYNPVLLVGDTIPASEEICIRLEQLDSLGDSKKEGFHITTVDGVTTVLGNDGTGVIYGCREIIDRMEANKGKLDLPQSFQDAPEMVLRGGCVGIQKMEYLPGRGVYEYPYTPESFPWFYDKEQWVKYLDMLVENRMNSLYLWNGHPFASLVKLEDYPFAIEVDDETFKKIIACIVGFLGIIAVNLNGLDFSMNLMGDAFVMFSAISLAISSVLMKVFSKEEDPVVISGYQFIMGGAVMVISGLILGGKINNFDLSAFGIFVYLSLLSAVAYALWGILLKHNPVSRVTIFSFMTPVFGVLLTMLILPAESTVSPINLIISLILVAGGVFMLNYTHNTRQRDDFDCKSSGNIVSDETALAEQICDEDTLTK